MRTHWLVWREEVQPGPRAYVAEDKHEIRTMYTVSKPEDFSAAALDQAARELLAAAREEAAALSGEGEFKAFRDRWMARKNGLLAQVNDLWLKGAPPAARREAGIRVNQVKAEVEQIVEAAEQRGGGASRTAFERLDISLPGVRPALGAEHPVIRTMREIVKVFAAMGYSVAEGPEMETDYYNFEALNFPPNHPARDTQDTLFAAGQDKKPRRDRLLLRTHTSPVQIRAMEMQPPPLRIVVPGKVHRA